MPELLIAEQETLMHPPERQPVQLALFPDLVPVESPLASLPAPEQDIPSATPLSPYQLLLFPEGTIS